jgi:tetratricopeptide (TPR) repeat protein
LLARGRCHLEKKDFSAAISDFRRAHKADEGSPAPLVALGDLHFARRDHPQAIDYFDQAIALESDHAQARCRRGMAHYHSGRYRQAFLDLQRAYKLDPEIPNIRRLVQMAIRKLEENS